MRRISLTSAIEGNVEVRQKFIENINGIINIAEKLNVVESLPITIYNTIEDTGEALRQSEYIDSEMDWFLTINKYRIRIESTIIKKENTYQLEMKYGLIDYYDWKTVRNHYDDYKVMLENIDDVILDETSGYLELFHKANIARNYTNYDDVICTIQWNQGERLGTGANILDIK